VRAAVAAYRLGPAESADAVQNTWLRLVERGVSIRDIEKLGGWLTTTARRECLALIRNRRFESASTVEVAQVRSPDPTPEEAVIRSEVRRRVRSATATLSDRPRAVIDALFSEHSAVYAEVARRTGMPIGSIGPTRVRALAHLRRSLSDLRP
jgi:RNA polymerase sigma factor (sigma-70 family)